MLATELVESNTKFYYYLCMFGQDFKSEEYDDEIECLTDFCTEFNTIADDIYWGQFCGHHYADEYQDEHKAVLYALSGKCGK